MSILRTFEPLINFISTIYRCHTCNVRCKIPTIVLKASFDKIYRHYYSFSFVRQILFKLVGYNKKPKKQPNMWQAVCRQELCIFSRNTKYLLFISDKTTYLDSVLSNKKENGNLEKNKLAAKVVVIMTPDKF